MSTSTLDASQLARFEELHDRLTVANEAQRTYDNEIVARTKEIEGHLRAANYGLAGEAIAALLSELRHDYGAQDFTPMFDRHVAAAQAQRKRVRELARGPA